MNNARKTCSVITICSDREDQLRNLIRGLAASEIVPDELIVVRMDDAPPTDLRAPFPIVEIPGGNTQAELSVSEARNDGAIRAIGDILIFLDVDCIPSPKLVGTYFDAISNADQLWMGQVRYLEREVAAFELSAEILDSLSEAKSEQPTLKPGEIQTSSEYKLFWSLNFACSQEVFAQIGGFDVDYLGYGAEDLDFSQKAKRKGIAFGHVAAKAWHQHHPFEIPPYEHFKAIVRNSQIFFKKWGFWPMHDWLLAFQEEGFIKLEDSGRIEILSYPQDREASNPALRQ